MRKEAANREIYARILMILVLVLIIAAGLLVMLWFGYSKSGFHEDEIYSFYSSNRTSGIAWPDREFMDSERLYDECVVLPGDVFDYFLVHTVQSWDVHPPLFYDILHTVCSVYAGSFSKWYGIGINMVSFVLSILILYAICRECGLGRVFTAMFLCIWAMHPVAVSAVMFIRMYMLLTVFVLTCLWLHLRMIKRGFSSRRMIAVMIVSFLGFLTHYYYLVFFFFTGVTLCLLWFLQKTPDTSSMGFGERMGRIAKYFACCVFSLGAGVLVFPASAAHIFRGYRGKEAFEAFSDVTGWGGRLRFFGGLVNDQVFSGSLLILLFLYMVLAIAGGRKDRRFQVTTVLVFVPSVLYFLTVSGTALIFGETSIRYMIPVTPLFLLIILSAGDYLLKRLNAYWKPENGKKMSLRFWRAGSLAMTVLFFGIFVFMNINGLFFANRVLFLYPEEKAEIRTLREHAGSTAVVLYNRESPENIWRLYDRLMVFDRAYYICCGSEDEERPEMDEKDRDILKNAGEIVVFAADTPENMDRDAEINALMRLNPGVSEKEMLSRKDMWTTYLLK